MPRISVLNESSVVTDSDINRMIPALEAQWNDDLAPAWKVDPAALTFVPAGTDAPEQTHWLVFLDDTDQGAKLAYHDLTNDGCPIAKIFARSLLAAGQSLSIAASHEICEMAIDASLSTSYQDSHGAWWSAEICDPVECDSYAYAIGEVMVSNFVTPRWFELPSAVDSFDKAGLVHRSFEILAGGYAQTWDGGANEWTQVNGFTVSPLKSSVPVPGSRRDRRRRKRSHWFRSQVDRQSRPSTAPLVHAEGRRRRK